MEDMTRVLALAAAGGCRLTQSSYATQLFQKATDRLLGEFISVPPWIETRRSPRERLESALETLRACKFADSKRGGKGGLLLRPTAAGRQWLSQSPAERLHGLLQELRKDDGEHHSTDEAGNILFRLSSAGRCFFGLEHELEYGQPLQDARVVVQPNFEIVFLHPNLSAEIDFTPFAERCSQGVGTLFRLTQRQTLRAAEEGLTVEAVLDTLEKHASSPVPANVRAELQAWFGSCRTLATRRAILLETSDAETALRVQKLLGPKAALLGKTLIEWPGANLDPKLRRKLAGHGIFIQS